MIDNIKTMDKETLTQDVEDARDAYEKARVATQDAFEWEMKMKHNFRSLESELLSLNKQ